MKKRLLLLICACALPLGTLTGCLGAPQADSVSEADNGPTSEKTDADEGSASAIEFEAVTIGGKTVSSDIFSESRLTMLNVWATYCNPCLNEMPGLGELASEYDSADFQIIGVISDVTEFGNTDTLELAESLIEETGADYTHLLLNESLYYALLSDVTAVPTTFFFDKDGELLDTVVGSMSKSAWEEKINELLEGL